MSTSHRGISEELVPHLLVVQLLQKHYSSGASIDRGPPDLYGTENAARAGVDGLSVRCKCAARRTDRSGNLGGAAGTREILRRIHGSQKVILRDLPIEGSGQARETFRADHGINFQFLHVL